MYFESQLFLALEEFFAAERDQGLRDRIAVAAGEADSEIRQEVQVARRQRADHAEIDHRDYVARHDEDVAGVRVGVEESVPQNHRQQHVGSVDGDPVRVEPGRPQRGRIVGSDAPDTFHHEQSFRAVSAVYQRNMHGRVVLEHRLEPVNVRGFERVVELLEDRCRKLVDQSDDIHGRQLGIALGEAACQMFEQVDVELDLVLDIRTPDLDDHFVSRAESPLVDLPDRRSGQRRRVELGEYFVDRGAQLFLDQRKRVVVVERQRARLQFLEFDAEFLGDHVGPVGQYLAELDERGAQVLDRHPDALGRRVHRLLHFPSAAPRETGVGKQLAERVLGQNAQNLQGAAKLEDGYVDVHYFHGFFSFRVRFSSSSVRFSRSIRSISSLYSAGRSSLPDSRWEERANACLSSSSSRSASTAARTPSASRSP